MRSIKWLPHPPPLFPFRWKCGEAAQGKQLQSIAMDKSENMFRMIFAVFSLLHWSILRGYCIHVYLSQILQLTLLSWAFCLNPTQKCNISANIKVALLFKGASTLFIDCCTLSLYIWWKTFPLFFPPSSIFHNNCFLKCLFQVTITWCYIIAWFLTQVLWLD